MKEFFKAKNTFFFIFLLIDNSKSSIFLHLYTNSTIFVEGILKFTNFSENTSLFILFSSLDSIIKSQLCNSFGYDDIHSLGYPCKLNTTEMYTIKILSTNSCCE